MSASVKDLHHAFTKIYEEIRQEGSEFDFRYSLVDHLFTDALGWSRTVGEGHVNFEDDQKDLLCFDCDAVKCYYSIPTHQLESLG